jgi:prepilin-type N-terminal cleavage/methylation domain-containing protein
VSAASELVCARERDERGVTLPELLVSIVILGLIVGPLAAAMIFFLQHGETSNQIFTDDSTARLAAAYFTADVQSSTDVALDDGAGCGSGRALASLRWSEDSTDFTSSWYTESNANGRTLVRQLCRDASQVARNELGLLAAASPQIVCEPNCTTPGVVRLTVTGDDGFVFATSASPRVPPS